jgi:hypothetical protein
MTVKAPMPVRKLNLVVPLAHEATAMRTTETAAPVQARPGAVPTLIGASLRPGDVDCTILARAPGTRTSTSEKRVMGSRAQISARVAFTAAGSAPTWPARTAARRPPRPFRP